MKDSELNPQQYEAANHLDGPTRIVAGAGSGKTRVLTHRYLNLLAQRVAGTQNILSVTFTNKAAREMKKRLVDAGVQFPKDEAWVMTFHAFGARILRSNIDLIYPGKHMKILNQNDSTRVIDQLIEEKSIPARIKGKAFYNKISRAKDDLLDPQGLAQSLEDNRISTTDRITDMQTGEIYKLYQEYLGKNGYFDFGDLLMCPIRLFEEEPALLEKYQDKFEYIQVDEYQDTNLAQHKLIMQIGGKHKNICVVGDPDQTIYTWRGAVKENLGNFEEGFEKTKTIYLNQNYRSRQNILDFANNVISNNSGRLGGGIYDEDEDGAEKRLWSNRGAGEKVQIVVPMSESGFVARIIEAEGPEYSYDDICVLYRTNRQSGVIEQELRRQQIPYWTRGISFYDRREVRDAIAYLAVMRDREDDVQLRRVLNIPRQGIGKDSIKNLQKWAEQNSTSLYEALENANDIGISAKARNGVEKLLEAFEEALEEHAKNFEQPENFSKALKQVLRAAGYYKYLEDEDEKQGDRDQQSSISTRKENVEELIHVAEEAEGLDEFLDMVTLDMDAESEAVEKVPRTALMTVHGAKGLEFPIVIVIGMADYLFPLNGQRIDANVEEERRLAYVAFTRAEEKLYVTLNGGEPPSRFISEGFGKFDPHSPNCPFAEMDYS